MNAQTATLEQIRLRGLKALSKELGPVGLVRFLQQFETGEGDYTVDRHAWLDAVALDELWQEMQGKQKPAAQEK
jgi:hypothetical protein